MLQRLIIPASLSEQNVKVCYIRIAAVETTATSTGTQSSKTASTMGVCLCPGCVLFFLGCQLPVSRALLASSCLIFKQTFSRTQKKAVTSRWREGEGGERYREGKES